MYLRSKETFCLSMVVWIILRTSNHTRNPENGTVFLGSTTHFSKANKVSKGNEDRTSDERSSFRQHKMRPPTSRVSEVTEADRHVDRQYVDCTVLRKSEFCWWMSNQCLFLMEALSFQPKRIAMYTKYHPLHARPK